MDVIKTQIGGFWMAKNWGVDSAAKVTQQLLTCVRNKLGNPIAWGRYLTTVPNVSDGLSPTEINFLHGEQIKIMPIYNNFKEAIGYKSGQLVARNTVYQARKLGIPKGKVLFANIEDYFHIDAEWIKAFAHTIYPTGYRSGMYANMVKISDAYCEAVREDNFVSEQMILWSSTPRPGTTKQSLAPVFKPTKLPCKANIWAWQYGRDAKECAVDTNLLDSRVISYLY